MSHSRYPNADFHFSYKPRSHCPRSSLDCTPVIVHLRLRACLDPVAGTQQAVSLLWPTARDDDIQRRCRSPSYFCKMQRLQFVIGHNIKCLGKYIGEDKDLPVHNCRLVRHDLQWILGWATPRWSNAVEGMLVDLQNGVDFT